MATEQSNLSEDLVQQIREGNQVAFTHLHDEYFLHLFYFTNKLIVNQFEAKRIVSETFMKLWQLRANFETLNSISAFLHVTCRNAGLDYLRHQQTKKSKREVSLEDFGSELKVSEDDTVLHQMIQTEVIKQIMAAIEELPPMRKTVLKLIYLEGLNTDEVAQRLQLTAQNVRNTKFQALHQLRNEVIQRKIISLLLFFSSIC